MDTIRVYLENMFSSLPQNQRVRDAKEELYQMMEDKYYQLLEEGKSDNEAVGQVINEFGNLDEISSTLGIRKDFEDKSDIKVLETDDIDNAINDLKVVAPKIALGVFLIFIGVTFLMAMLALYNFDIFGFSEDTAAIIGVVGLLVFVGIAVYNFIVFGMKMDKHEYLEKTLVQLSYKDRQMIVSMRDKLSFPKKLGISVMLFIISPICLIITSVVTRENEGWVLLSVAVMLILIGLGVYNLIKNGIMYGLYQQMLQEGEYAPDKKMAKKKYEKFTSIYWLAVVAVFFIYSFTSDNWNISWIVFPVAGIIYAIISTALNMD